MTLVIPDEDKDKFPEGYPDSPFARTTAFPDQGDSYRGASFPSSVGDIMWASALQKAAQEGKDIKDKEVQRGLFAETFPDAPKTGFDNYTASYPTSPSTQPPGSQFNLDRDPRPGPPPGLDPLEKPPVTDPSDKEQEDISDANTRQDMIQDMREGNLNPYTLTDAQLEFFTKGTGTTREQLAEMFGYDRPAEDPAETSVEDADDDAVDDEQATQDTIQDIRDGELNPYEMTDEELADIGLTRAQAEDIYGGELSEEEQRRYVEGTLGDYNTEETKKRNLGTLSDLFEEAFVDQIPKDEDEDSTTESGEFAEGEWDWLKNEPEANKPAWLRTIECNR